MIVCGEHNNSGLDNELEGTQLDRLSEAPQDFTVTSVRGKDTSAVNIFFTPDGPRYSHRFT